MFERCLSTTEPASIQISELAEKLMSALHSACQKGEWEETMKILPHLAKLPHTFGINVGFFIDHVLRYAPKATITQVLEAVMDLVGCVGGSWGGFES